MPEILLALGITFGVTAILIANIQDYKARRKRVLYNQAESIAVGRIRAGL